MGKAQAPRLFVAGGWDTAAVNQDPAHPLWPYARGYWLAAEAIAGQVLTEGIHHDLFVHPLVFLYRQAIELDLKHLIAQGGPLAGRPPGFPHGHGLMPLWEECRSIILRLDPTAKAEAQKVGTIIAEFAGVDPKGEAFRYPVNKDGQPSLPGQLRLIDLRNVATVMEGVQNFLDGAGFMLQAQREFRAEMEQYEERYSGNP